MPAATSAAIKFAIAVRRQFEIQRRMVISPEDEHVAESNLLRESKNFVRVLKIKKPLLNQQFRNANKGSAWG